MRTSTTKNFKPRWDRRSCLGRFALFATLLVPTAAIAFCDSVQALSKQESLDSSRSKELLETLKLGKCSEILGMAGSSAVFCTNEFDFRADDAQRLYDSFSTRLKKCLPADRDVTSDTPVNHPDFYALKRFDLPAVTASVSIKDKAQLQKTYVFVRLVPR